MVLYDFFMEIQLVRELEIVLLMDGLGLFSW